MLHSSKAEQLFENYPQVFKGIGKLKDTQIELHIDPNVQPVTQPHRRIPFHIKQQVEEELQRLKDLDILEHVDGPTDWVSPIVVAPKPKRNSYMRRHEVTKPSDQTHPSYNSNN